MFTLYISHGAGREDGEWRAGIMATVHRCGNALNYNPHVHLIGTRELVNVGTGEIQRGAFFYYRRVRFLWMDAACRLFARQGMFSKEEISEIKKRFTNGFHVHFKPVAGEKLEKMRRATWADAVLRSCNADPRRCPDCCGAMVTETVFSHLSEKEWGALWKTHRLYRGYFRRIRVPQCGFFELF